MALTWAISPIEVSVTETGAMIDISNSNISKMKTLERIVDLMAGLKLNQLQLYIEGVAAPYASGSFSPLNKGPAVQIQK